MGAERLRIAERGLDREMVFQRDFSLHGSSSRYYREAAEPCQCSAALLVGSRASACPGKVETGFSIRTCATQQN
jgi:hypothetical protein